MKISTPKGDLDLDAIAFSANFYRSSEPETAQMIDDLVAAIKRAAEIPACDMGDPANLSERDAGYNECRRDMRRALGIVE